MPEENQSISTTSASSNKITVASSTNYVGKTIQNRYKVEVKLGQGAMAEVYGATDLKRNSKVALKFMLEQFAEDPEFERRFRKEAAALQKLQHPNIVRFYELGREGVQLFMVMDWIEGIALQKHLYIQTHEQPENGLSFSEAVTILKEVGSGLQYAHASGILHRDVKPGNVMLSKDGKVHLADFGISKATDSATVTLSGIGTPAYMSPEQCAQMELDSRSDVYALGIMAYEMFAGKRPFRGDFTDESETSAGSRLERVRRQQLAEDPAPPSSINADIPVELDTVLLKCLAKKPDDRYESCDAFIHALNQALPDTRDIRSWTEYEYENVNALDVKPAPEPKRRKPWLMPLVILVIAIAGWFGLRVRNAQLQAQFEAFVEQAELLSNASDYAGAITAYDEALLMDPQNTTLLNQRGVAKRNAGDFDGALVDHESVLTLEPQNTQALYNTGLAQIELEEYDSAIASFDAVVELDPTSSDALASRADAYYASGNVDAALADYDAALNVAPDDTSVLASRATVKLATGDYAEATEDIESALALDPNNAQLWRAAGDAKQNVGEYDAAIAAYNRALELEPNVIDALYNRGTALFETGDYASALADYAAVIAMDPAFGNVLQNHGHANFALGNNAAALADYLKVLETTPNEPTVLVNTCTATVNLQDYEYAAERCSTAIAEVEASAPAWAGRCEARYWNSYWNPTEEMLADCDQAISLDTTYAPAYASRCTIKLALHDREGALEDCERAVVLEATNATAWAGLCQLEPLEDTETIGLNEDETACEKALLAAPDSLYALYAQGIQHFRQENYDAAITSFTDVIELDENFLLAWVNRGYVKRWGNEDYEGAVADYNRALELQPEYIDALMARANIYRYELDDSAGAMSDYTKVLQIDSEHLRALVARAGLKNYPLEDYEGAIEDATLAIEIDSTYTAAWAERGSAKRRSDDYEGALADFDMAIELEPERSYYWSSRAQLKNHDLEDYEGALADYDMAIQLDPDNAYYDLVNRGAIKQYELSDPDLEGALADYDAAVANRPDEDHAYTWRASVLRSMGQYEEALASYDTAVQLNPSNAWNFYVRGRFKYFNLDDVDGALSDLSAAIELEPNNSGWYVDRGVIYLNKLNNPEKAIEEYTKAIDLDLSNVTAYFYRAQAHDFLGNHALAVEDLQEALRVDPNFDRAQLELERIQASLSG